MRFNLFGGWHTDRVESSVSSSTDTDTTVSTGTDNDATPTPSPAHPPPVGRYDFQSKWRGELSWSLLSHLLFVVPIYIDGVTCNFIRR